MGEAMFFGSLVLSYVIGLVYWKWMMKKTVKTADGYQMSIQTAHHLAKEANEDSGSIYVLYEDTKASLSHLSWGVSVFVPYFASYAIAFASSESNLMLAAILPLPLSILIFCIFTKGNMSRPIETIEKSTVKSLKVLPGAGIYLTNPFISSKIVSRYFEVHKEMAELIKSKEQYRLEKMAELNMLAKREVNDTIRSSVEFTDWYEARLGSINDEIHVHFDKYIIAYEKELKWMEEKAGHPILTNTLPEGVTPVEGHPVEAEITNIAVESDIEASGTIPHHVKRMRAIVESTGLPDELKSRAERLLREHEASEREIAQDTEIAEALLEIETLEKYYTEKR